MRSVLVHIPFAKGTRVRVIGRSAPESPYNTGIIEEHRPENGGYLVRHNMSPFNRGLFAGESLFGWAYDEVVSEEN